jgi:hypothetical protein
MRPRAEQEVARLARGDDILAKFYEIRSAKFALGQMYYKGQATYTLIRDVVQRSQSLPIGCCTREGGV